MEGIKKAALGKLLAGRKLGGKQVVSFAATRKSSSLVFRSRLRRGASNRLAELPSWPSQQFPSFPYTMEAWFQKKVGQWREYRHQQLAGIAQLLLRSGISAEIMTFLSLSFGILAAYFLFSRQLLFILFALLHLLADGLDGVLAAVSERKSKWGSYLDYGADQAITLLILLKIAFLVQDYYAFIAVGLFVLSQLIYLLSTLTAPILFTRTALLLVLFLYFPPTISWSVLLPTVAYGLTGVASLYSLARQLQWGMGRR